MTQKQEFESFYQTAERGANLRFVGEIGSYTSPALGALEGFDHGFSARTGGVSKGFFSSLNLSFTRPEEPANVTENYRLFCRAMGIPFERMVMDNYAHETTVLCVSSEDAGRGYLREPLPSCDGLVTNDPSITLITGHADCMAFYCVDPGEKGNRPCTRGMARQRWAESGANVIRQMTERFGTDHCGRIRLGWPFICPTCFEVGRNVAESFEREFGDIPCEVSRAGEKRMSISGWWRQSSSSTLLFRRGIFRCLTYAPWNAALVSHRRDMGVRRHGCVPENSGIAESDSICAYRRKRARAFRLIDKHRAPEYNSLVSGCCLAVKWITPSKGDLSHEERKRSFRSSGLRAAAHDGLYGWQSRKRSRQGWRPEIT